jgi:hypothetical protein
MVASSNMPMAEETAEIASRLGLSVPVICLPRPDLDFYRWAVVACDQYTSQPDYWQETAAIVGHEPSTLNLILPEIYLEHPGDLSVEDRISRINTAMRQYLADGTLCRLAPGWIVTDRATPGHESRKGLVLAIDLEHYDYRPGNSQLIRATEGTVLDRIPPRLAIRREAPLELPHVQLLIDDPGHTVIEPLLADYAVSDPLYDTELMRQGGHIRGHFVPGGSPAMLKALQALAALDSLARYGLLFAVGDGNHSLATAKAHWESLRDLVKPDHPARYALVEVVNIHDPGLTFEPIHRVIYNLAPEAFLDAAVDFFAGQDLTILPVDATNPDAGDSAPAARQVIPLLWRDRCWKLRLDSPRHKLVAGSLQDFLDNLVLRLPCRVDYIHGDTVVHQLADQGHLGLLLPALDKRSLFSAIAQAGVLPRKTFSMGEAFEKRYYIECRQIR